MDAHLTPESSLNISENGMRPLRAPLGKPPGRPQGALAEGR